ncbi:hypothetical protein FJZ36_07450 [Candidatus Poribacteria bacterium]|nr:hypothetical protein [Candidatus Poribacteria bacterium]
MRFRLGLLFACLAVVAATVGCRTVPTGSRELARVSKKTLPDFKAPLLKWHQAKFLRTQARSAPALDEKTHPHGWKKGDCARCHQLSPTANLKDCSSCHGANGLSDAPDTCQSCHNVASRDGRPNDRMHSAHMTTTSRAMECWLCHPRQETGKHANGSRDVLLFEGALVPASTRNEPASCADTTCHETRVWSPAACTTCHGYPPSTGLHQAHLVKDRELRTDIACESCHGGYRHESGVVDISPGVAGFESYRAPTGSCMATCHENTALMARAARPTPATSSWDCTSCHEYPPPSGNHPAAGHTVVPCASCHSNHTHTDAGVKTPKVFRGVPVQVSFAAGGTFRDGLCGAVCHESMIWGESCGDCHGYPPQTGRHVAHVEKGRMLCRECHTGNDHDLVKETGEIDVRGDFVFDSMTGSCQTTCHEPKGEWGCDSCHGNPPSDRIHPAHRNPRGRYWDLAAMSTQSGIADLAASGIGCAICHADHKHSATAATNPKDFSAAHVDLSLGDFIRSNERCQVACHEPFSWQERCNDCHETPPKTGDHLDHVDKPNVMCVSCHGTISHDRPVTAPPGYYDPDGVVTIAAFDEMTGDCQSNCHLNNDGSQEMRRWDCRSCHGTPPTTGAHADHDAFNMGCRTCHAGHVHNSSAVIHPLQFSRAAVELSLSGTYDRASRSCSDVGCHRNDLWLSETERTLLRSR